MISIVDADGERFAVRRSVDGGTAYEWLTGTDQGWGTSDSPDRPYDAHVADLRDFLRDLARQGGWRHSAGLHPAVRPHNSDAGRR